jgi:hypothetical protein
MTLDSGRLGEIADFLAELSEICNEHGIFSS